VDLTRPQESLKAADLCLREGLVNSAASRAYEKGTLLTRLNNSAWFSLSSLFRLSGLSGLFSLFRLSGLFRPFGLSRLSGRLVYSVYSVYSVYLVVSSIWSI